jgi:hypothetical protein
MNGVMWAECVGLRSKADVTHHGDAGVNESANLSAIGSGGEGP